MALDKWKLLTLMMVTSLLAGCRTMRNAGQDDQLRKQQSAQIQALIAPQAELTDLTARTATTINYNQQSYNIKGRLRMRRGEVVQMSFTALGVVEVALLEFTPAGAYLIDRVNKRYAKIDYSSGLLNSLGVNFATIQALFWNRLFVPGKDAASGVNSTSATSTTPNAVMLSCTTSPRRMRRRPLREYFSWS